MTQEARRLALDLYDCGVIKDKSRSPEGRGFRLKLHETTPNAPLSPIYINLRTFENPKPGPLTPDMVNRIGQQLYLLAQYRNLDYSHVASVPNAGDPFAKAFIRASALDQQITGLILMQKQTESDQKRQVVEIREGNFQPDDKVLLVDDLITRAHSKLEAIWILKSHGLSVRDVLVLVDREQGGQSELAASGFKLHSLFTLQTLLDLYLGSGRMKKETYREIAGYLATNQ